MSDIHTTGSLGEDVFSILSNQRRRYTIRACQQLDPPFELGELAEYVAAEECGKPISEITSEERRRVYSSLQQVHLDKLEDAGVIECERKTIKPTERLEELEFYLEVVPGDEILWAEYYLGLAGVAAALTAAVWVGLYSEAIPPIAWLALLVGVLGVSAAVHYLQTKRNRLGVTDGVIGDE
ncbi:DUF7344 domain-containing protein [Halorubrum sp. AS12]|uniref:DUF7344 domain-containing protein n=1 Tax=Halorubrum sp. AS12 TaxID=3409687 RepID=UPI003DA6FA9E